MNIPAQILVLDFGSQYTQLIARRLREYGIYTEIVPYFETINAIKAKNPRGLILSGGPASVYEKDAFKPHKEIFALEIPVLGICYGMQYIADFFGGEVVRSNKQEFGKATLEILPTHSQANALFKNVKQKSIVWMSHADKVQKIPHGFSELARSGNTHYCAIADFKKNIYALQFHPEVAHSECGGEILLNFARDICRCDTSWNMKNFAKKTIEQLQAKILQSTPSHAKKALLSYEFLKMQKNDLKELSAFCKGDFAESLSLAPKNLESTNLKNLENDYRNCVMIKCSSQGRIVGFASGYKDDKTGIIQACLVNIKNNHQTQGIARTLIQTLQKVLDTRSFRLKPNEKNITFYENLGFSINGEFLELILDSPPLAPVIITKQFVLRECTQDDFEDLHRIMHESMGFTKQQTQRWLQEKIAHYKKHGFGIWAIINKKTRTIIGCVGLEYEDSKLFVDYAGDSTQQTLNACIEYAFRHTGVEKLYCKKELDGFLRTQNDALFVLCKQDFLAESALESRANPVSRTRCEWVNVKNPYDKALYEAYHDNEWGVPLHDDKKLFEFLALECFQAGLSWISILKKREALRAAFDDFNPEIVANYDETRIENLMQNENIIRNRKKIEAVIANAKAFLAIQKEHGSFDTFLWNYVDNKPVINTFNVASEIPAQNELSSKIANDLQKRGFKFVGSTTIYAYMQAVGLVNDHVESCFCKKSTQSQNKSDVKVLCAVSGGVDSSVVATLLYRAIGENLIPVFVDTGLLRKGEREAVESMFREHLHVPLIVVNASELFLKRLKNVIEPEKKRKIIGETFIEVFENEANKHNTHGEIKYLAQGTLYPDVIESVSVKGPSKTIKSHHNVGGLPEWMRFELIEPLRELFKDEVRALGRELGMPESMLMRHPFPGPGLAIRIMGEANKADLDLLREADSIFIEELHKQGLYDKVWQAFCVLLNVRSVGVMGDNRTYDNTICLRAVEASDGMTAHFATLPHEFLESTANRIINEVKGINRVVYDITSKPPGTIEWE